MDFVFTITAACSESRPGVLPLSARGRHLPSSWTHHFTPHTCAHTHHFTPHTCTPTHHFTPHTCAPTHHSQLFPMCGLFMHLSPVPLAAKITSTRTHMCMYVCSLYFLSDRLHSVSCTRDTSTTLPSGVSRC